jgi:hypothetical protein
MIGAVTGLTIRGYIKANIVDQIVAAISLAKPVANPFDYFNNVIMIIFSISTLVYFFFTIGATKMNVLSPVVPIVQKLGRYVMMAAFGTVIGGDIFARVSMMTARIIFLLTQWLGL